MKWDQLRWAHSNSYDDQRDYELSSSVICTRSYYPQKVYEFLLGKTKANHHLPQPNSALNRKGSTPNTPVTLNPSFLLHPELGWEVTAYIVYGFDHGWVNLNLACVGFVVEGKGGFKNDFETLLQLPSSQEFFFFTCLTLFQYLALTSQSLARLS